MSKRYTEGIAGDGAAILDNGTPITITEILNTLNDHDKLVKESDSLPRVTQWVAVDEQLPPNETKEYEVVRNGYVEFDVWYYRDGKGCWYNYLGVTHWKEKPEPPCG